MVNLNMGSHLLEDLTLTLASSGTSEGHSGDRHTGAEAFQRPQRNSFTI